MKKKNNRSSDATDNDRKRNDALNKAGQKKKENKLPGDYPPQEDIMNRRDTERVGLDVENFSRGLGHDNLNRLNEPAGIGRNEISDDPATLGDIDDLEQSQAGGMEKPVPKDLVLDEDDMDLASGNESDVTKEDLEALGPKDLSLDMGEDEQLKNRVWPVDMAGEDLDIPGAELDDKGEAIGSEDEENNAYSLNVDRED